MIPFPAYANAVGSDDEKSESLFSRLAFIYPVHLLVFQAIGIEATYAALVLLPFIVPAVITAGRMTKHSGYQPPQQRIRRRQSRVAQSILH